jgi:uncharacterized FlgJ-related protein
MIEDAREEQLLLAEVDILEGCRKAQWNTSSRSRIVRLAKRKSIALEENLRSILLLMSGRMKVHEPSSGGLDPPSLFSRT